MRASLSLYLLGPLRAQRDEAVLTLRYNKARALLAWLALEPGFHTRDSLADLFWPDAPTQAGRDRLKRMLFHLREVLGDDVVETSRHVVRLNPQASPRLDTQDFLRLAETGRRAVDGHEPPFTRAQLEAFEQAARLVRGPFLHGLEVSDAPTLEQWIDNQRECFSRRVAALLGELARGYVQFGAWRDAIDHARRLTALTPADESAWQLLIRLLMDSGQRDAALIELARCREALANTMDEMPDATTLALVARRATAAAPAAMSESHAVRRLITIVCCELQPASAADPDDMSDLLRLCRDECTSQLQRAWGYVKRAPSGDLLAYFGCPDAIERSAQRAVAAALDLLRTLRASARDGSPGIVARMGVHTAFVVSSAIDSMPDRVGAATRVACQLASQAADGEVSISDATLQLTGGAFDCVPRGLLAPAGVRSHRVLGERAGTPPRVGLIGRERELDALAHARQRYPAVLVTGDAGVGKSALIRGYRAAFDVRGVELACEPNGVASPLHPFARALEALARGAWRGEPDAAHALRHHVAFDELRDWFGWLDAFAQHRETTPEPITKEAAWAYLRCAINLAVPAGGMLWIDNLQWADTMTLDFIEHLLLHPVPARVLILTARVGFCPPWCASKAQVQQIGPLTPEATGALIDREAGGALPDPAVRERIANLTDGVPLHVEACVRDALTTQRVASSVTTGRTVPAELHDVLMARLDAADGALPAAQIASVIGGEFAAEVLAAALDTTRIALAPTLDALIAHRVIRHVDTDRYAFRYALLREAAYQSLTRQAREAAHRRIDAITGAHETTTSVRADCICAAGDDV